MGYPSDTRRERPWDNGAALRAAPSYIIPKDRACSASQSDGIFLCWGTEAPIRLRQLFGGSIWTLTEAERAVCQITRNRVRDSKAFLAILVEGHSVRLIDYEPGTLSRVSVF